MRAGRCKPLQSQHGNLAELWGWTHQRSQLRFQAEGSHMRILTSLVVALFLATGMSPVLATSVPKREKKQERRIERGIKHGKITPKEAQRLRDQQATISVERELAKKDGKITGRERAQEQHDLNALSKDIHRKKYNKRRVYQ